ncbi:MAG: hypothetical protein GX896_05440 [Clostridiales bacterium]|nr:hypothetical protein [Clostridiales bacterium]
MLSKIDNSGKVRFMQNPFKNMKNPFKNMKNPLKKLSDKQKGKLKVALAYFITLSVCLLFFGLAGKYIINKFVDKKVNDSDIVQVIGDLPTEDDRNTILYLQVDNQNNLTNGLIVRNLPDMGEINIVPVTPYMTSQVGESDSKKTLIEIYNETKPSNATGAVENVTKAVENAFDIKIDKYMTVSNSGFDTMINYFGGVSYMITENIFYSDPVTGEEISIEKGNNVILTNQQVRLFLNYPLFENGRAENLKIASDIMTRFLNGGFLQVDMLESNIDNIFNSFYSDATTNISKSEYLQYKGEIIYVTKNYSNFVESRTPVGAWSQDGKTFELNKGFREEINNFFELTKTPK